MPVRWVCDGQDAGADIRNGAPRLLGMLGVASTLPEGGVAPVPRTAAAHAPAGATAVRPATRRPGLLSFFTRRGAVAVGR